jgi:hypothetical protein
MLGDSLVEGSSLGMMAPIYLQLNYELDKLQIMCDISTSSAVTQPEISKNKWRN